MKNHESDPQTLLDNKEVDRYNSLSKLEGIQKMTEPEYTTFDEYKNRNTKLNEIKELNIEPLPS